MASDLQHIRRGEGEPLLLIMGLAGTHLSWGDEFLDALARDFDVIAFSNRGIGGHVGEGFTIADMAHDATGLLDELGIDNAHVLGVSMGGMIAQELVLSEPDRVTTLTLGCTYAGGPGSALTDQEVAQRLAEGWSSGDREKAIRAAWEENVAPAFAARDDEYAAFRERALALRVPLALIRLQIQAISQHDVSSRLGEIETPTLVVHGELDRILDAENGRLIASAIPGARLEVMEGIGHLFWLEEPERSAGLVREHARAAAAAG